MPTLSQRAFRRGLLRGAGERRSRVGVVALSNEFEGREAGPSQVLENVVSSTWPGTVIAADAIISIFRNPRLITIVVFVVWVAVVLAFYFAYGIKRSAPESVS